MNRTELAKKYFKGYGIEIGAGPHPWPNPDNADILYVERELGPGVDVLGDGFNLTLLNLHFPYDFILNSHVLEHTPDPINAIREWSECLSPGGFLIMAVPDKDETFDLPRELTPLEMLDHKDGADLLSFKIRQYVDWVQVIDKLEGIPLRDKVQRFVRENMHVHFPVWNEYEFDRFINHISMQFGFFRREFQKEGHEFFVVLEKA